VENLRVVIVGAGIGGLTAAIALRRAGIDAVVLERAKSVDALSVGAGIHLWGNALQALQAIGMGEAVADAGTPVTAHRYLTRRGRSVGTLRVGKASQKMGAPTVGVTRTELHRTLVGALEPGVLRLNCACVGFEQDSRGVVARLADGREEHGDILVGADGINSVVRKQLHGWTEPRYSGITVWRAICDYTSPQIAVGEMSLYWGAGARIVHYHVSGQRLYWVSMVKSPPGQKDPEGGSKAAVTEIYRGWPQQVQGMIAATDEAAILRVDIADRDPLKRWGQERVTLLGDAAHPMSPDMAQGAGQSIEDGVSLAVRLRRAADPVSGLQDYERRRIGRANSFVKTSRIVRRMGLMEAPLMCVIRDQVALPIIYAAQAAWKVRSDLTPAL
jgi:2-polyprenyl-6-methoxyphenol hydroxylase-like FAD-dependent oxidoreductase